MRVGVGSIDKYSTTIFLEKISQYVIVTTELLERNVFVVRDPRALRALGSRTINTLCHIEASVVTILSQK